jgi:2,4-dienoyl-CoA reductase-like NADH-dependent reductase (Old Yellow Enzyme family)
MATELPPTRWPSAEEAARSRLLSSLRVGAFESRTRGWVPAMVPWRATEEGFVTPQVLEWYGRFAEGWPGVLVVEATGVRDVPSGPLLRIGDDRFLPGLRQLVETVGERSGGRTRLVIQVLDFLRIRRRPEPAAFFGRFLELDGGHRRRLAELAPNLADASDEDLRAHLATLERSDLEQVLSARELEDLDMGARERVTDLHLPHIAQLPKELPPLFAAAARRAREAGFDGLELHMAHAYTLAGFLSRRNTRDDGYGGGLEGRQRLPVEVIRAVRAEVGEDWTVGCRLLGDEVIEGGSRLEDAVSHSLRFAAEGLDFISVSKGGKFEDARQPGIGQAAYPYTGPSGHECMPTVRIEGGPFGRNLPLSRAVREALREAGHATPVVGAGGLATFEAAEEALESGACDLVGAARQSLADPDWWRKVELGHGDAVRRCVFTNYCEGLDQKHKQVTCQLWDRDLAAPDRAGPASLSHDGRRRLLAPPWQP